MATGKKNRRCVDVINWSVGGGVGDMEAGLDDLIVRTLTGTGGNDGANRHLFNGQDQKQPFLTAENKTYITYTPDITLHLFDIKTTPPSQTPFGKGGLHNPRPV